MYVFNFKKNWIDNGQNIKRYRLKTLVFTSPTRKQESGTVDLFFVFFHGLTNNISNIT